MTWLIVGLGNPGKGYRLTRHNAGFLVLDRIAQERGITLKKRRGGARIGEGRVGTKRVVLAKPLTYMNKSGESVRRLIEGLQITRDHLVVIHDDLDLACGRIKLKTRGGDGGHKGMHSIIEQLGSGDFLRLKVGIGKPRHAKEGADYVLSPFSDDQISLFEESLERAAEAIRTVVVSGKDKAMNLFN